MLNADKTLKIEYQMCFTDQDKDPRYGDEYLNKNTAIKEALKQDAAAILVCLEEYDTEYKKWDYVDSAHAAKLVDGTFDFETLPPRLQEN